MNITINISEPIKKVQEFQEYDLGQITTTLQDLLDNSSIIVDSNTIPILKVLSIDDIVKKYLIKDLSENSYNTGDYITGQDLVEEDLLLISGDDQNSGTSINTAFVNKVYSAIMDITYDSENPNFDVNLTGNLDLTVTGTSNGDFGVVNLYFTSNETATINGVKPLSLVGAGEMVTVSYIHDIDGIKWYNDSEEITTIYNIASATSTGTFSNVGNICTGVGTTITANMVGAKIIKANGEEGIIATRISNTSFTTKAPFATDSVSISFKVKCVAYIINADGSVYTYDFNGNLISNTNIFGGLDMLGLQLRANNNIFSYGYLFQHGGVELYSTGNIKTNLPFYADDAAAAADGALSSGQGYRITGSTAFHIKP